MADERVRLGRREFTEASILALLSGVAITISGCGGGGYSSPAAPSNPNPPAQPPEGDVAGSVSANHGHMAVVTRAQIVAAAAVTLDITGSSDHPHAVDLTAEELGQIGSGRRVSKSSSSDAGHTHTVTFN